jgi:uncharacterized protein
MNKVALIGASGNAGSRILSELRRRQYSVTAIVRDVARVPLNPEVTAKSADVADLRALTSAIAGSEILISSLLFEASDPAKLIQAAKDSGVRRYIVVGGAGSLEISPGLTVLQAGKVPAPYRNESAAGVRFLQMLRETPELDWTFISPSAEFVAGDRTGVFRLGTDSLLIDANGRSRISYEDFAVALVNEVETGAHHRQRFTVGY